MLRGGPGRCGLVLGDVRKPERTDPEKKGMSSFHFIPEDVFEQEALPDEPGGAFGRGGRAGRPR